MQWQWGGAGKSAALNRVVWQELSAVFASRHTVSAVLNFYAGFFVSFQVLEYIELKELGVVCVFS